MNLGSKAENLITMKAHGIRVPDFATIKWEDLVEDISELEEKCKDIDFNDLQQLEVLSKELKDDIEAMISDNLSVIVDGILEKLEGRGGKRYEYSVRSSTANEDGADTSFAGQFKTYLNVNSLDIESYVIRCVRSLYNVNVLKYCSEQNVPIKDLAMNVIVQKMVNPQYSGIIFTANPQGILNESVIVVGEGVGANVVEDKVETTSYYYNITDKVYYYEPQGNGIILEQKIIEELMKIADKLKNIFGEYIDIEYAIDEGKIYILQVRPITTIDGSRPLVLDNSNIVESYPGITLPLTSSFVNMCYTGVFRGVVNRIVDNEEIVRAYEPVLNNMVGCCNGRMYYKISNWYSILRLMPFKNKFIKVWQEMLGVKNTSYSYKKVKMSPFERMSVYTNLFSQIRKIQPNMDKLERDFNEINEYFKKNYNEELSNRELIKLYQSVKKKVLFGWDITLLNDAYAFAYTGLLKAMLKQSRVKDYEKVANEYISGITNIESMKPVREILKLAKMYLMVGKSSEEGGCTKDEFNDAFFKYIDEYGDRALEELKLESKTFRSHPELLMEKIVNYIEDEEKLDSMIQAMEVPEVEMTKDNLKGACAIDRAIIRNFGKHAMQGIKSRESSRLNRSRIYGFVRSIFTQIGRNMHRDGILEQPEDIFYLYKEEIMDMIEDSIYTATESSTKERIKNKDKKIAADRELIRERKEAYEIYAELPTYSRVVFSNDIINKTHVRVNNVTAYENAKNLKGIPCSSGVVEGEVLVIEDVTKVKDVKDKILVTKMTDPGWVFLLVEAKGIITEKGSLLSHTAIISRELNIPAVVGVENVLNKLKTGDYVTLDGDTGKVSVEERSEN
ncbi:MAG: phosphoenolpyruvate synthase [Lachnospiraceae bacterium]|nr:phosphoenolpyruvate synthase [Lachnospiraceae bacterium]